MKEAVSVYGNRPTTRLLSMMELLQARERIGVPELARRLEVGERAVRRYAAMLREMGIPIEAELGRYGAYSLRSGYRLPPMMFTAEEALGLALGLLAARHLGLAGVAPAVEGALAKLERVMPEALRGRVRALQKDRLHCCRAATGASEERSTPYPLRSRGRTEEGAAALPLRVVEGDRAGGGPLRGDAPGGLLVRGRPLSPARGYAAVPVGQGPRSRDARGDFCASCRSRFPWCGAKRSGQYAGRPLVGRGAAGDQGGGGTRTITTSGALPGANGRRDAPAVFDLEPGVAGARAGRSRLLLRRAAPGRA